MCVKNVPSLYMMCLVLSVFITIGGNFSFLELKPPAPEHNYPAVYLRSLASYLHIMAGPINILISLPDSITRTILQQWLVLPNVRILDSAFCNRSNRPAFHKLAYGAHATYEYQKQEDGRFLKYCEDIFFYNMWLMRRNVAVSCLSVPGSTILPMRKLYASYLKKCGTSITTLAVREDGLAVRENDLVLELALTFCPALRNLKMVNCYVRDAVVIRNILTACTKLRCFDLDIDCRNYQFFNDACCKELSEHCPSLCSLILKHCVINDSDLSSLLSRCPNLQYLHLEDCAHTGQIGLLAVAKHCKKLRTFIAQEIDITDVVISAVTMMSAHLTTLKVDARGSSTSITDASVFGAALNCPLLKDVEFCNAPSVTDRAVATLVQRCTNLQKLSVRGCSAISDASLIAVGTHCKNFRALNIDGCPLISDSGLTALYHMCKHLKTVSVDLTVSLRVTEQSVKLYSEKLFDMGIFDIQHLEGVGFVDAMDGAEA